MPGVDERRRTELESKCAALWVLGMMEECTISHVGSIRALLNAILPAPDLEASAKTGSLSLVSFVRDEAQATLDDYGTPKLISGVLAPQGPWFQGELTDPEGTPVGGLQLRRMGACLTSRLS